MRANQRKIRNYGILFLVLAVVLLFPWELRIPADFEVLPFEEGVIRAETAGLIEDVYVREGTAVQTGDLIARLSDFEKESELERIRGEIGRARAELQLLELGPRAEEVNRAAQQVNISETRLGNVRRNEQEQVRLVEELAASRAEFRLAVEALENAATLYEEGLEAGFEVSRARTALEVAEYRVRATEAALASLGESNDREEDLRRSELAEAESNYSLVSAGPRSEDVRRLQVELDALERLKALIEEELALTEILAPISGTVITENMDQLRNRAVSSGEELARIVNFERVKARLAVAEIDLADVHLGRRIVLKARPDPLRNFEGEVDFIAPVAQTIGDSRFVDVETILASEDGALRPGTTGVAKIYAGRRLVIQLISRRLMHWIRTEFWDLIP
jgi:multidrug resistance efflux pump